jgi:hypothetical protein
LLSAQVVKLALQVVTVWQPLLPLHLPVLPQDPAAAAAQVVVSRGAAPFAMDEHMPA